MADQMTVSPTEPLWDVKETATFKAASPSWIYKAAASGVRPPSASVDCSGSNPRPSSTSSRRRRRAGDHGLHLRGSSLAAGSPVMTTLPCGT